MMLDYFISTSFVPYFDISYFVALLDFADEGLCSVICAVYIHYIYIYIFFLDYRAFLGCMLSFSS